MKKLVYLFIIPLLMAGCRTTSSTTTEREIRDSIRIVDSIRDSVNVLTYHNVIDSVRIKDSTVVVVDSTGKVIFQKEIHIEKSNRIEKDSTAFYKALAEQAIFDAVKAKSEKKEVIIEKKLSKWQQFKVEYGGYAIAALLLLIAYKGRKYLKKYLPV